MDASETPSMVALPEGEAVVLLSTGQVGRLVYTRRALPAVTPVNYALRDGAIWIWTASASSMAQAVPEGGTLLGASDHGPLVREAS